MIDLRGPGGENGQAAVELALVIPVLLLIMVALCQLALTLNCYLVVTSASREGARRGAETNEVDAARKAAISCSRGLPGNAPDVDVSPVTVRVSYGMPLLLPGLDRIIARPTFSRSTTMCLERDR
jgi:Flp pilus assembly protein TadG